MAKEHCPQKTVIRRGANYVQAQHKKTKRNPTRNCKAKIKEISLKHMVSSIQLEYIQNICMTWVLVLFDLSGWTGFLHTSQEYVKHIYVTNVY